MVFFEGYAKRVGRKTGGGSLAEERRERGRDFPLRSCFTVLHRQVTDLPPLASRPAREGEGGGGAVSPALKPQHFLSQQRSPWVLTPPRRQHRPAAAPPSRGGRGGGRLRPPALATVAKWLLSLAPRVLNNSRTHQFKKTLPPHVSLPAKK